MRFEIPHAGFGMTNDYFVKNPGIYLVTDKISDPDILSSSFPQLKNRITAPDNKEK